MNAVIYCRVSSKEQVDGTSLESQERACQEFAARNHLGVLRIFTERGESAKFADRPQLLELLAYCRERKHAVDQLLVWKVDRLARNVADHYSIKAELLKANIRVVSVTEPIDANPEGKLLETMLAGFAQFDNDIRAARTLQGMRHKLQEGLFPWKAPLGYRSVTRGEKKTRPDVPEQPAFGLLQQVWLEFATGRYTKAEIVRLLDRRGLRTRKGAPLAKQSLDHIFRDPFYAGIVRDPWSGEEHIGRHIPMVSRQTFAAVQQAIDGLNRSVPHLSTHDEFPLRMFVRCSECQMGLTAAFSTGRKRKYPYYRCFRGRCGTHLSYPLADVHNEFAAFLSKSSVSTARFDRLKQYVLELAENETALDRALQARRTQDLEKINQQQQELIRMKLSQLINDHEFLSQRDHLSREKQRLEAQEAKPMPNADELAASVDEICRPLMDLGGTWQSISTESRRRFQLWAFPSGYVYGRIGTAERGRLFSLLFTFSTPESNVVHLEGQSWSWIAEDINFFAQLASEVSCPEKRPPRAEMG